MFKIYSFFLGESGYFHRANFIFYFRVILEDPYFVVHHYSFSKSRFFKHSCWKAEQITFLYVCSLLQFLSYILARICFIFHFYATLRTAIQQSHLSILVSFSISGSALMSDAPSILPLSYLGGYISFGAWFMNNILLDQKR